MKKNLLAICFSAFIFIFFINNVSASEVVISGASQFDCSLSAKFMEKHGYVFIEESYYKSYVTTNMYAAAYAKVTIENEHGAILGAGMADKRGRFSITVPKSDLYKIVVTFHGHKGIKQVQFPKIDDVIVYLGFVKSEIVDNWLRTASLD
jgi:CTP:phosphocholine cytidylyltransferase-like protein